MLRKAGKITAEIAGATLLYTVVYLGSIELGEIMANGVEKVIERKAEKKAQKVEELKRELKEELLKEMEKEQQA